MNAEDDPFKEALRRIYDACIDFNELMIDYSCRPSQDEKINRAGAKVRDLLNASIRKNIGYGGLKEIQNSLEVIARPIEEDDRKQLANSPIKSEAGGDRIQEGEIYRMIVAAVAWLELIKMQRTEFSPLLAHESFQVHLNEILALPTPAKDAPDAWGKVITEIIWYRRAEEYFHVYKPDLEPGGKIHSLIIRKAESELAKRKRSRSETFKKETGMDYMSFVALDHEGQKRAIESLSGAAEETDKAAVRATQLASDAHEIFSMAVSDGDLKTAFRERIREKIGSIFR